MQAGGAVADVVVAGARRGAGQHREHRCGAVEGLDLGLLVHAEHQCPLGGIKTQMRGQERDHRGADRADLQTRPTPRRQGRWRVQDLVRHLRHRDPHQRLLSTLDDQAIPQRRSGAAHRNRRQLAQRPGLPAPANPPRRAAVPGSCNQHHPARSILNVSARAASLRVQPLSESHSPPSPRMAAGPRPYGSATLGSRPWPAPYAPPHSSSPASRTRACAP